MARARADQWSEDELSLLEDHIGNPRWLELVSASVNRSTGALKARMAKLRSELGLGDGRNERGGHDDQDAFNANAVVASQILLDATLRVGRWS